MEVDFFFKVLATAIFPLIVFFFFALEEDFKKPMMWGFHASWIFVASWVIIGIWTIKGG